MASIAAKPGNRRTGADRRSRVDAAEAAALAEALAGAQIELLFQPQYAAATGEIVGAEALARWRRGDSGVIGGEALFAAAGRARQVPRVSRYLARLAFSAAAAWARPMRLSLNVTAEDLATDRFAGSLLTLLAESGLEPERVTLEITEQSLVEELDTATRVLEPLAARGLRIALDDFGAGFCNFRYLKRLPLHALKLDRSMIEGVPEDARDVAVLRGIVAMATALGLEVIAEGVETQAQRDTVTREGCAAWQGFLGSPPVAAAAFTDMAFRPG